MSKNSTSELNSLGKTPVAHTGRKPPTDKQRRSMNLALADTAYSGWQPVRIDAGAGGSTRGDGDGFFINSTGLQWNSSPGGDPALNAFGGWIVCDWWHGKPGIQSFLCRRASANLIVCARPGVPQLFFRLAYYDLPLPSSCADIYLRPEYI